MKKSPDEYDRRGGQVQKFTLGYDGVEEYEHKVGLISYCAGRLTVRNHIDRTLTS